jgi:5-methylcytosine-specific restriction protein A
MARRTTGRPCRKCRVGVHYGTGYCEKCQPTATSDKWALHHKGRTTTQRGYGAGWEQIKKRIAIRDKGLCKPCARRGVVTSYSQVDHKVALANGGTHDDSNLECICTPCHDKKTAQDRQTRR